jgi:pimeloyl-ACP methyl ester carboxylesterase
VPAQARFGVVQRQVPIMARAPIQAAADRDRPLSARRGRNLPALSARRASACAALAVSVVLTGCGPTFGPQAKYGITFYCPGAGNIDFGDAGIREGLQRAGYRGQVASLMWTVSFNPAIDQILRVNARGGAARLADYIKRYADDYPDQSVNVVGLSAGTGVAIWALEDLPPKYMVDNVVLLSSSLYYRYDVSRAVRHVKGKIYVFYSSEDAILAGPMKIFGTIDGVIGEDGAGAVGLHPPGGESKIVNIAWTHEFSRYGYYGGHTDSTSPDFVRAEIAPRVMTAQTPPSQTGTARATAQAPPPPDGRSD